MGKEEERLGNRWHANVSAERDDEVPGEAQRMQLQQSRYITSTTPTGRGEERKLPRSAIIKWFFLCSVYGPMVIHW